MFPFNNGKYLCDVLGNWVEFFYIKKNEDIPKKKNQYVKKMVCMHVQLGKKVISYLNVSLKVTDQIMWFLFYIIFIIAAFN